MATDMVANTTQPRAKRHDDDSTHDQKQDIEDECCPGVLSLRIFSLNVCGLKSKPQGVDFKKFINNYDNIGLSETKLSDLDELEIPGYEIYIKNRKNSRTVSGGRALLVKTAIAPHVTVVVAVLQYCSL